MTRTDQFRAALDTLLDENKSIGRKIYDWLMDMEYDKHHDDIIITNFDIDVVATCKGRQKE